MLRNKFKPIIPRDVAVICMPDCKQKLHVRTDLIENFPYKIGSLFQFIGEYRRSVDGRFLKARIARNVDGLDFKLYKQAVLLCRKHGKLDLR